MQSRGSTRPCAQRLLAVDVRISRHEANGAGRLLNDAGLRVLSFGKDGREERGDFIALGGNDFWGVSPLLPARRRRSRRTLVRC